MKVTAAIELALQLMAQAQKISARVSRAQAEGRAELTDDEWSEIKSDDDAARQRLADAIAQARGG